ncbi:MAG: PIN domain-containing protein [Acidiferrobacteraceae bacterium]
MIALDTNILVRLVTRDDEAQAARAKAVFDAQGSEEGALFVSDIVLVELCWTLERSYRLSRQAMATVIHALLDNSTVKLESPPVVRDALAHFTRSSIGFPDCLIVAKAQHQGCRQTLTFDRRMASLPDVEIL